jgi:hypothetical protein
MNEMPPALPHGKLEEVFPNVFFVTGMMKTVMINTDWQFSRNMTVVRDDNALTLINALRLDDAGLAQLAALGRVANVVNIASRHGRDDAFYKTRYGATSWTLPSTCHEHSLPADKELAAGGEMPFSDCSLFSFRTTKQPEAILNIDREGGILVSGDSLQNYLAPDEYYSDDSRRTMTEMGFFQYANFGPIWMKFDEPQEQDFVRLLVLPFQHLLPGHGSVLRVWAKEAFTARFQRVFCQPAGEIAEIEEL